MKTRSCKKALLDQWFEHTVKPRLEGSAQLIRYADDAVLCFRKEADARRVYASLSKRFEKYGLTLHPEKTKLVHFQRSSREPGEAGAEDKEDKGGFKFLGFQFYMGESLNGHPVPKVKTEGKRLRKSLKGLWEHCQKQRHKPIAEQHAALKAKVQGHINHYAVSNNSRSLATYRYEAEKMWRYWLNRRGAPKQLTWEQFRVILHRWPWVQTNIVHKFF